ncbi:hypothetical protein [Porphyromonas sp.]|uniref:hypothetical protein n=1 Tax=Porphyromonas sp. TaxID=1924944 RepID=UPI002600482F|nr:hypothetical protein [Porphyromonas sp.]
MTQEPLTGTDAQTERPYSGLLVKSVPTAGYSSRASLQRVTRQERPYSGLLVKSVAAAGYS